MTSSQDATKAGEAQTAEHDLLERLRELRDAEARLRTIFDCVNDAIIVQDIQSGSFVDVNLRMCDLFGYTRDEALQLHIGDICSGESGYTNIEAQRLMERAAEGLPQVAEWHVRDRSGSLFWIEMSLSRANVGDREQLLIVARDITERKLTEHQLRESEARFRTLFDTTADSLYLGDPSGRFVEANRKACQSLGYSREELLNLTAQEVVVDYPKEAMEEHWRQLRDGRDITMHCTHRRKDGSTLQVEAHLSLFEYCDQTYVLAVARDITERLRDEEEKRALEQQMEEQKRRFYKETIFSVTGGKLDICEQQDVDVWLVGSEVFAEVQGPADVPSARHRVHEYCRTHGMKEDILKSFVLGVGEAVTNALKHAGAGMIYAGVTDDKIWIGIADTGPGIDSLILPRAVLSCGFSTIPSLGMGYSVILDVADQVHLKSDISGTTVILEKSLRPVKTEPSIEDLPDVW